MRGASGAMVVRGQRSPAADPCGHGAESGQVCLSTGGVAADDAAHTETLLCDAPVGSGNRHADDPGALGPSSCRDHVDLHPRDPSRTGSSGEPAGSPAEGAARSEDSRGGLTLGQLLRQFLPAYLDKYPHTPAGGVRVLHRLKSCRTAALGGHVLACTHCGEISYHYHSCGDRHCPSCGGSKRASWLERQRRDLLPVGYFHVVFTLPHELSALALGNRKLLYDRLFAATSETLQTIGADRRHLGARLGALLVLHTWGQQLEHHPHIHAVVPGGGLSLDGTKWVASRANFLVSAKVLGRLFRGKFLAAVKELYEAGELRFAGSTAALAEKPAFRAWLSRLYAKDWGVYAKKPFASPEVLLKYLTRYTHRVALSNGRLKKVEGDRVTLSYKDYSDGCRPKEMTLTGSELLRRFALHVLPKGFVRVRQCGILAHRGRHERLALCRRLLSVPVPLPAARLVPPAPLTTEPTPGTDR